MARDPRQTRRTVAGTLLIAGLLAATVLTFFLESLIEKFRSKYEIVAVVRDGVDLVAGSPVWIAGREVGVVSSVGFMPHGGDTIARIAVVLELPRRVQSQVRADSRVRLTAVNLLSERVVDIGPGTERAPVLGPGDTLRQERRPTPAELTARAATVKAGLDSVLVQVQALTPAMNARLLQTQRAVQGLDIVMTEAARLQRDMDANPGLALLRDPAFAAAVERAQATARELPLLIGRLQEQDGAVADVRSALARLQQRAEALDAQLAAASAALENPNGSLARLQQDTAIQRAINAARAELDSLIVEARRNPLRFVF
jgi:ABC-type transporter Mla subunit MlaD